MLAAAIGAAALTSVAIPASAIAATTPSEGSLVGQGSTCRAVGMAAQVHSNASNEVDGFTCRDPANLTAAQADGMAVASTADVQLLAGYVGSWVGRALTDGSEASFPVTSTTRTSDAANTSGIAPYDDRDLAPPAPSPSPSSSTTSSATPTPTPTPTDSASPAPTATPAPSPSATTAPGSTSGSIVTGDTSAIGDPALVNVTGTTLLAGVFTAICFVRFWDFAKGLVR